MDARLLFASEADSTKRTDFWSYDPSSSQPAVDLGIQIPAADPTAGEVGGTVLFVGLDPASGEAMLYATDGTAAGTGQLALPVSGTSGAVTSVSDIQFVDGEAFITGTTADGAQDLWISDATAAGTSLAITGMDADSITEVGSLFYFAGNPQPATGQTVGTHGLFCSDGTTAGTVRLTPSTADVAPDGIVALADGEVLFRAAVTTNGVVEETVWVTDGTVAGTHQILAAGLPGGPVATALTLDTPAQTTPDSAITLTGTYAGNPAALDYNFGSGWIEASSVSFRNGIFSFTVSGGVAAGSYVPEIRDHDAPSVSASAGVFVASAWTPETLAVSPGAKAVFEFNPNDPADLVTNANGDVTRVLNSVTPSEYLTVETGSDGHPVTIARDSGANGKSTLLQFDATTISSNIADPGTNWLDAGGVGGAAGSALVDLANSSDLKTSGSFTTVIAIDINKSYTYEAGPIWGALASPGPLQYVQLRINEAALAQGANLADSSGTSTNAQGTITAGWHVMTMIKTGNQLTYRLDGKAVTTTITSTASFTASDFMIGGGFPQGAGADLGQENGVPAPYVGEFQAYSGVLQGTDLANAEALAANSVGLTALPSTTTQVTVSATPAGVPSPMLSVNGLAVFTCLDTAGNTGLWVSDGTTAGTVELGRSGSGAKLADATSLVALGSVVLFSGTDDNGVQGLWRSDGTQAGTVLVSTLGTATNGAAPSELTLFGNEVAFAAVDSSGVRTLWLTDGTAGGTHEILPAGAASGGLAPTGLGVFYDQLLFTGTDAQGQSGLWMSDGTATGTHEVSVVAGNNVQTGTLETTLEGGRAITLGSTPTVYAAQNGDTVSGGSGAATISASSGSVLVQAGAGALWFVGGNGSSTVVGGSGPVTVIGGSGGGVFSGGSAGGNVLVANGGNTTLTGGGAGDRLFGSASGQDVMVAAQGRETLIGGGGSTTMTGGATAGAVIFTGGNSTVFGGAAGGDTVIGGSGSLAIGMHGDAVFAGSGATKVTGSSGNGADSIIGGSGTLAVTGQGDNMLVVGGSGASTVNTGNGADLVFTGAGTMMLNEGSGAAFVVLGSANAGITEGTGPVTYDVVKGAAGGTDTINGFRPGSDQIALFGYGSETAQVQTTGGNSVLSLSDGTRITLLGILDPGMIASA